ncbi:MAG: hypothetical protein DMG81_00445 [Acidobacteria bacterium]|nr:MAG: hypothetical protein DMG81_00445 [Acidobacteriota bacterium]
MSGSLKQQHTDMRWNSGLNEWFCATCGRTSDHTNVDDARKEMEHFTCVLPFVDTNLQRRAVCMLNLRLVEWLDTAPTVGECTSCGSHFKVPARAETVEDALESIRQQFVKHECRPDASIDD